MIFIILVFLFSVNLAIAGPEIYRGRDFDPSAPGAIGDRIPAAGRFGSGANYIDIDSGGILTLHGTAKCYLTIRPRLGVIYQIAHAKPTQVQQGVYFGYSMPIYNADNEELFFTARIPYRWDGESDFVFEIYIWLSNAEDAGDKFKFQLSWEHANPFADGSGIPATSNDVTAEYAVLIDRVAQYSCYRMSFVIDYDIDGAGNEIVPGNNFSARLRRIDATDPDITNEIVAYDWKIKYPINKFYGTW